MVNLDAMSILLRVMHIIRYDYKMWHNIPLSYSPCTCMFILLTVVGVISHISYLRSANKVLKNNSTMVLTGSMIFQQFYFTTGQFTYLNLYLGFLTSTYSYVQSTCYFSNWNCKYLILLIHYWSRLSHVLMR